MTSVFFLTLRQLSGRWRLIIMTVLGGMPVLIAVTMLQSSSAPSVQEFETYVLSAMLAGAILPLMVLAIASAAFANEIEDKTLANLTLAPIPRWQIVLPKLFASICIAAPFMVASAFGTSFVAFSGDWQAALAITSAALVGVTLYSSAFTWLGLKTTRPMSYGLVYIVLWEGFFARYVAGVRFLSIRYYSIGLMRGFDARRFVGTDDLSFLVAIAASVVVLVGFVLLSIRRLRHMDVP
jgi:ABC-2 type transport system permease protein